MTCQLPPRPNLDRLKSQAKALLKAHKDASGDAAHRLSALPRFADASPQHILEADLSLQEAQHVVALEYGLASWSELRSRVASGKANEEQPAVVKQDDAVWLRGVPSERPLKNMPHCDGVYACMRVLLKSVDVDEQYLSGNVFAALTGQPFRFWFDPNFSSCLGYTCEAPVGVILAEALGFACTFHAGSYGDASWFDIYQKKRTLDQALVDSAWQQLQQEIDSGHPVVLFGGQPEVDPKAGPIVVTGYSAERDLVYYLPHHLWHAPDAWDESKPRCKQGIREEGLLGRARPNETNWIGTGFAPGQGMGGAAVCFFALGDLQKQPTQHEVAVTALTRAAGLIEGNLIDEQRPERRSGVKALDLLAAAFEQSGDHYDNGEKQTPWSKMGESDWWYAMETLVVPEYRAVGAAFIEECANGFGDFTTAQRTELSKAHACAQESVTGFRQLWNHFQAVGSLESYDDHVNTINQAFANQSFRHEAARIVRDIIRAESQTAEYLRASLG